MNTPSPETGKSGGRWLRVALIVSLAVNLALLGAIGTRWAAYHRHWGGHGHWSSGDRLPVGLGLYGRALDEADRRSLASALAARRDALTGHRAEVRQQMHGFTAALRAERFDPQAALAALAAQRAAMGAYIGAAQAMLIEHAARMDAETRSRFADRIEQELARREAWRARAERR